MKKIVLFVILLALVAGITAQAQAEDKWLGIGLYGFKQFMAFEEGKFFDDMTMGVTGRLKFNENFGIMLDIMLAGTYYYYQDIYGDFYGPDMWDSSEAYYTAGTFNKDEYGYTHSEFVVFPDIAFFIPLGMFQLYAAVGPALYVYTQGEEYDNDPYFRDWYDTYMGSKNQSFSFGLDTKLGMDVFLTDFLSLGCEFHFIVPDFGALVGGFQEDANAMMKNSWVGITGIFWL